MPRDTVHKSEHTGTGRREQLIRAIKQGDLDGANAAASWLAAGAQSPLPGFACLSPTDQVSSELVLGALREAVGDTANARQAIREAFARCPDVTQLAVALARGGLKELWRVGPRLYLPVRPALARRYRDPKEVWAATSGGEWLLEPKLDGWECQIHMGQQGARLYSRRGEDLSRSLPTVVSAVEETLKGLSIILESEVVALAPGHGDVLPCTDMRRKDVKHKAVVFDLLYLDGDWTRYPCNERFAALCRLPLAGATEGLAITEQVRVDSLSAFDEFFRTVTLQGQEGIIGKRPDAPYEAGARTSRRIKIKTGDTVDAILTGYNAQSDAYLAAVYDADANEFVPFAWVSSGLSLEEKEALAQARDSTTLPDGAQMVVAGRSVDLPLEPTIVAEIAGDRIQPSDKYPAGLRQSKRGWTLWAARFLRLRPDKGRDDVTSLDEFLSLPVTGGYEPPDLPTHTN